MNAPLVIGAYPPTLLDVQNADAENERHQPFQNCSSLLVDGVLIRDSALGSMGLSPEVNSRTGKVTCPAGGINSGLADNMAGT